MRRMIVAGLVVLCAACGSTRTEVTELSGVTTSPATFLGGTATNESGTGVAGVSTSSPVNGSEPGQPSEEDLTAFLAATAELLAGTVYEDGALEQPELFLATGMLFCDWLDAGADADAVVTRYLDELAGGVDVASDDELVLTGALLGASAGVLCPEHQPSVG